jgi:hypothetical protein
MDCRLSPLAPRDLVSEYQYYDFRGIDRPLTKKEMAALRSISTWAAMPSRPGEFHPEPLTGSKIAFLMPEYLQVRLGRQAFAVSGSFARCGLA